MTPCGILWGCSPPRGVGRPLKPGHLEGPLKPVGSRSQGKKASSGPGESLPGNSVREQDHSLLGKSNMSRMYKYVLNVCDLFRCYFHCHHDHNHFTLCQEVIMALFLNNRDS